MNKKNIGILFVLGAAIIWSIEALFVRFSLNNLTFLETATYNITFAMLPPFFYSIFTRKSFSLNRMQLKYNILTGVIGTALAVSLYYFSLSKTSVLNSVLLVHTQPFFIILLGYFFFKERLNKYDYIGGLLMFISATLVVSRTFENLLTFRIGNVGDFVAIIATIIWALFSIIAKKYLIDMDSGILTFYRFFFASIPLLFIVLLTYSFRLTTIFPILTGLLIGVGTIFYYTGLKRLQAAQVGFVELSTPIFAAFLARIFLSEYFTTLQLGGIIILIFGVFIISKKGH